MEKTETEMTILKSLANFFKIHERWRSSFKKIENKLKLLNLHCLILLIIFNLQLYLIQLLIMVIMNLT